MWTGGGRLRDLDYADDISLISDGTDSMKTMTEALSVETGKIGLEINVNRTKIMKVKTDDDRIISFLGENIEVVDEFVYLGHAVLGMETLEGCLV